MKHIVTIATLGLALCAAIPAQALNARSFVSGHGSDAAACTLAAPCRTLAGALAQTNSGGEIDVLDAAGYGTLTINKAISIVNDGIGTAGVIVSSGSGIIIDAGANDAISLRGLSIEGGGVGTTGINFIRGGSLTIEKCVIRHLTGQGIGFGGNAATASSLSISNSLVADNGLRGILVAPAGSGTVTAVFNRVQVINNALDGIIVDGELSSGTVKATVYDSVASGNGGSGIQATSDTGAAPTTLMVFHSVAANNDTGLKADGEGAILRVIDSMVTGNAHGWATANTGVVDSYGDNAIDGNAADETAPPLTVVK